MCLRAHITVCISKQHHCRQATSFANLRANIIWRKPNKRRPPRGSWLRRSLRENTLKGIFKKQIIFFSFHRKRSPSLLDGGYFNQAKRLAYHQPLGCISSVARLHIIKATLCINSPACGHISLFALALSNNKSHPLTHAGVDFILQQARFHHEVI